MFASESLTPITHELTVETSKGEGQAIAAAWNGVSMLYLVVSRTDLGKPEWVQEADISAAYIGDRPA